ncbi:MAG: hypothetical protein UZ21_OP11001000175 [Microgenomates bacterium OLB22]|nr:MAG: hypothetical protein UZ21_OP11001000175 [Microgenomates bacterium OLB22]
MVCHAYVSIFGTIDRSVADQNMGDTYLSDRYSGNNSVSYSNPIYVGLPKALL